jgi:hypothetical protein
MIDHQFGIVATSGDGNAGSTAPLNPPNELSDAIGRQASWPVRADTRPGCRGSAATGWKPVCHDRRDALNNVLDSQNNSSNVPATMGVLVGHVNASGVVTSGDTNLCKAQAFR